MLKRNSRDMRPATSFAARGRRENRRRGASGGRPEATPTSNELVAVLELELPGSEPVRSRVDDAVRVMPVSFTGHVGQACDLDVRHTWGRNRPRPATGLQHAEV